MVPNVVLSNKLIWKIRVIWKFMSDPNVSIIHGSRNIKNIIPSLEFCHLHSLFQFYPLLSNNFSGQLCMTYIYPCLYMPVLATDNLIAAKLFYVLKEQTNCIHTQHVIIIHACLPMYVLLSIVEC